ncbi:MAG: YbaB/EbfC family nucleoid-associated protein [Firmicutes bacterium]|nr:YbaB/EbfC family nucleoid-associated protein [Bacillota bacterium]
MKKRGFNLGGGGGGNMQQLMKQAQQMQEQAQKAQEEIANMVISATAGGGMITVEVSGDKQILSVKIKPEAVDEDDIEMLEDLIIAVFNDAFAKADRAREDKLGPLSGLM